jgi:hypothetical protein
VPEVSVPTLVREEAVIPAPRVVLLSTDVPLIENALPLVRFTPPATVVLSEIVTSPLPLSIIILPVDPPPIVSV